MKKLLFILAACFALLGMQRASAQLISVVSPEGQTTLYTDFAAAVEAAPAGSFVYLPANRAGYQAADITKELHLVGVGYRNDLNEVEGATVIRGRLNIKTTAANSSFTGIRFLDDVHIQGFNKDHEGEGAHNVLIQRCRLTWVKRDYSYDSPNNLCVRECEVEGGVVDGFRNAEISHCIFYPNNDDRNYCFSLTVGGRIHHNLMLRNSILFSVSDSHVYDNIIVGKPNVYASRTEFRNNLVCGVPQDQSSSIAALYEADASNVFVNYSLQGFSDGQKRIGDFHLKSGTKFMNAATDGGQLGIYGGATPWKDSTRPFNPHIDKAEISDVAQPDGTIKVKLEVSDDGY